jgi:hypothetical protein
MNSITHAEFEFSLLENVKYETEDEVPIVLEYKEEIINLIKKFSNSGQSGMSAPITASIITNCIKNLMAFKPIGPLVGNEEEWNYNSDDSFQNNRLSAVFKTGLNGKPYYLDAITFVGEEEYDTFHGHVEGISSRQYLKGFPFFIRILKIKMKTIYVVEMMESIPIELNIQNN